MIVGPGPHQPDAGATEVSRSYESPAQAYEAGRKAFQKRNYATALKPLRYAARHGVFLAKYYLAEILSDTRNIFADPREAYELYTDLVDNNTDVDPYYDYRARFVARAYVMKGRYLSGALPAPDLKRSQRQARRLFGYAATYLDDPDAQYEFARMLLSGRGGVRNVRSGKHYLSTLSRKGHAAAQGYLAELFRDGEHVPMRPDYALALSTLAVRNTPREDRIWLSELHQKIYCAASPQTHEQAARLVTRWGKYQTKRIYPRKRQDVFSVGEVRWSCANAGADDSSAVDATLLATKERPEEETWPDRDWLRALHGSVLGFTGSPGDEINLDQ